MAGRRKTEVQLQMQIESQEEWEELLSKEGLNVIDIYQEWCGPCNGMVSNFKKIKNELGDPLLKFITAKADTIDSLDKYRGHCEPCFLFYAGGCLVAVVRGANSPKILRTITEQLKQEHKVMDGNSERKEIKDPFIAELEAKEKEVDKEEEEEEEEGVKEVTVALIKPDAVQAGKVDDILADIKARGIEVLQHEERKMTEDEVRHFYSHLTEMDYFDDLCKFMTSGPSHILVLTKGKTGENIISEFRDLIGPTDVDEAKTQAPESLRAKHGEKTFMNALHGSSSSEMASRELAFFFPDFAIPTCETAPKLQRTLALVRPEAFKLHKDDIISKIRESGFKVAMQKEMQLTKEMAEDFYKEHKDQPYFDQLVSNMSSGPVLALGLAREDAIQGWRDMLGPKEVDKAKEEAPESLRAKFAVDDAINSLHGSDSEDTAKKELQFFFPMEQTVAVIKPDAAGTKDEIIERIHEAGFKIAARKETILSRELAEQFYSEHKDKDFYPELIDNMTSGPTYMMVLSREGAVDGWRSMIGPTDPSQAKEEAPESLRACYGENILKNAVHGSSNPQHAQESMKVIFGSLKFCPDGSVLESIDEEPEGEKEDKPVSQESKQVEETAPEHKNTEEEQQQEQQQQQQSEQQQSEDEQKQEETKPEQTEEEPKTETETDSTTKSESQTDTTETQVEADTQKEESQQEISKPEEEKQETQTEEKTEEKPASPKPSETEAQPSEPEAKPSEDEAKPSETEAKPSEDEAKPSETEAKPSEGETEQTETEAKPSESETKPDEQTEEKTEEKKDEEEKKEETQSEEKPKTPEAQTTQEETKEEEKKEEEKKEGAD